MNRSHSLRLPLAFRRFTSRLAFIWATVVVASPAFAQSMIGQGLLQWVSTYIIGPIGIFAVVIALAGAVFNPQLAKAGLYAAGICAVLFFVIRSAPALVSAMSN